jgi:hypothetical protein
MLSFLLGLIIGIILSAVVTVFVVLNVSRVTITSSTYKQMLNLAAEHNGTITKIVITSESDTLICSDIDTKTTFKIIATKDDNQDMWKDIKVVRTN